MTFDLATVGLSALAVLSAVAVIILAVRALRRQGDDDEAPTPGE